MIFFPEDASLTGHWIDHLFWVAFGLTAVTFVVVAAILVFMLVRYRAAPGRRAHYTRGDSPGAVAMTMGLALAVFVGLDVNLAVRDHLAWEKIWGRPPAPAESVRVQVMGEQFAWNIRYTGPDGRFGTGDDVSTLNELHVPVGKPVVVQLSSKDVIHSFFLPNFRIKQDAMPGMVTNLYFQAKKRGSYDIACAEHCGFGHYRMRGFLVSEAPEAFEAWLTAQAAEAGAAGWPWPGDSP